MYGHYKATDKQRQAQKNIVHECDCGRTIRGNVGWKSHLKANPTHAEAKKDTDENSD